MFTNYIFSKSICSIFLPNCYFKRLAFNTKRVYKRYLFRYKNMQNSDTATTEVKEQNVNKNVPNSDTATTDLKDPKVNAKISATKKPYLFAPSEIYLCVLGNGANNSARALYMFTDHGRYLFNCGEGTQRLAHEHKMKLAKLEHVFITHKSWANLGGLLGLSLTCQEIGVSEINLHGPPKLGQFFKDAESFVMLKDLNIVHKEQLNFVDGCMHIQFIPVHTPDPPLTANEDMPSDEDEDTERLAKRIKTSEEIMQEKPKEVIEPDIVMAFACKGHSKPGQLLMEKCVEQGVPPGPLLGDLKNGKDVVLPCGKIVYSKDVVSEEQQCPVFLVVECPNEHFIESFLEADAFRKFQKGTVTPNTLAGLVVHFSPPEVIRTKKYQEWMERFSDSTSHLIINSDNSTVSSSAIHRIQHKLNLLHPSIFPLLQETETVPLGDWGNERIIQTNTLDRYLLRPAKGLDRSLAVNFEPQVFIDEALNTEGFQDCLANLKICIQENSEISPFYGNPFPEVIFLGTGSCIPSKVRNVSAILVRVCKFEYFLLDCGEGTTGQIMRIFGSEFDTVLKQLIGVFISHMHADHHLGLIQLLKARAKAHREEKSNCLLFPLFVIGPPKLDVWLRKYHKNVEKISSLYTFIESSTKEFGYGKYTEDGEVARFTFFDLSICTVPVNHCPDAYAFIMTDKFVKWKLVYSGDTTPCVKLITAGKNCTLLIHEATMEDELGDEAALKKHSTTSQAIEVAVKMKAKHTILTHFSQRYAKVPLINENFNNQVGCAFDNMRASRKEFSILPLLIPTLKCLFAEDIEELKTKGDKRLKKQELISQMAVE